MTINEVFPNPTLKQVIFQIRYPSLFYIENRIGDLQIKIMQEFPESALAFRRQIVFADVGPGVKLDDIADKLSLEPTNKLWQFRSARGYELNVLNDSLDISSQFHKTYNNPSAENRFRDVIQFVLESFLEVTKIPLITRVGLRYIDECPVPANNNEAFLSYYATSFPLARFNLATAREMQFIAVVKTGERFLRYAEKYRLVDGQPNLTLDFDGFAESVPPDECLRVTDELHALILSEYERTIKEPVYQYMRRQKEG